MHSIPTTIAEWRHPGGAEGGTYNVYRTSQGRIAVRHDDDDLVVVDTVDHLAPHVPAELVTLVQQRMASA